MKIIKKQKEMKQFIFCSLNCGDCFMLPDSDTLCMKTIHSGRYNFVYLDNGDTDFCDPGTVIYPYPNAFICLGD